MVNERIKELAEQAGLVNRKFSFGQRWEKQLTDEQKKFAELIVQECINTVQKRFMGDNNREDMEVLRCVSELKNHFRVE